MKILRLTALFLTIGCKSFSMETDSYSLGSLPQDHSSLPPIRGNAVLSTPNAYEKNRELILLEKKKLLELWCLRLERLTLMGIEPHLKYAPLLPNIETAQKNTKLPHIAPKNTITTQNSDNNWQ